jgi:hypothetical protein
VGNLDINVEDYFKLSFIITKLGNLDAMFGVVLNYIPYSIMAKVGNLDANLGGHF